MKRILIISLILALFTSIAAAQNLQLSERSYIEVYTCAPGNQLYSQFGHTAIGVIDPERNINAVFNYGTFSFNTPHFYLKFCAGKLLYRLSAESLTRFISSYEEDGREVVAQRLNLTLEQRQQLFDNLIENHKPENRYYQYDFFFDNCASRVLDMLYYTFNDTIKYCSSDSCILPTLRDCIHPYLNRSKWTKLGIDLVLGSITDRAATHREQTFIPDKLHNYLADCRIDTLPLVESERVVVPSEIKYGATPWFLSPMLIFSLLLIAVIILTLCLPTAQLKVFDRIYFGFVGFFGLIISLLWFATDHGATVANLNILWASPLYLVYLFTIGNPAKKWHKYFVMLLIVSNILMLPAAFVQDFNGTFYLIVVVSLIRLGANYCKLKPGNSCM
ncbi:MAG: DUF4105 domain-containing protein [Salinivirgaceae bacterium]|nr:DUF4105 domain-containing protein [Salinivirgaceae bacterium]